MAKGEIDVVTFTSSSTVKNLLKLIKDPELLKEVQLAAIGPITAETMQKNGLTADIVAAEYTIEGLVQSIKEAF